jgi:hypothetical protein
MSTPEQLDGMLHGRIQPSPHEYNAIAVALNEHFVEFDPSGFVPYMEDDPSSN